jgi:hypothetical protein
MRAVVDPLLDLFGDLVEELVERDEVRPLHVPVGLLRLGLQIDRVRETSVQQLDERGTGRLREIDLRLVHGRLLRVTSPSRMQPGSTTCPASTR